MPQVRLWFLNLGLGFFLLLHINSYQSRFSAHIKRPTAPRRVALNQDSKLTYVLMPPIQELAHKFKNAEGGPGSPLVLEPGSWVPLLRPETFFIRLEIPIDNDY